MSVTAVCVRLIGTDLVAMSAFDTLVRKMGYADLLVSLRREEVWLLGFGLGDKEAGDVTRMLVEETGIFVNPNTHNYTIVRHDQMMRGGGECGAGGLEIAVWSGEDPQVGPVATAIRERMEISHLEELRRLVLWRPFLVAERTGNEERERVISMVAVQSREKGLLANPHYQCWSIIEENLTPCELLDTVCEVERTWLRNSAL